MDQEAWRRSSSDSEVVWSPGEPCFGRHSAIHHQFPVLAIISDIFVSPPPPPLVDSVLPPALPPPSFPRRRRLPYTRQPPPPIISPTACQHPPGIDGDRQETTRRDHQPPPRRNRVSRIPPPTQTSFFGTQNSTESMIEYFVGIGVCDISVPPIARGSTPPSGSHSSLLPSPPPPPPLDVRSPAFFRDPAAAPQPPRAHRPVGCRSVAAQSQSLSCASIRLIHFG